MICSNQVVKKYALHPKHAEPVAETLREAIGKHEADNALFQAEVEQVGLLIAADDAPMDDDGGGGVKKLPFFNS